MRGPKLMLKLNPSYIELIQLLRVEIGVLTVYLSSRRPELSERCDSSTLQWLYMVNGDSVICWGRQFNSVVPLWKGILDAL